MASAESHRPDAVLAALADVAPRTVVWLNETQLYLGPDPLGERVAARLRELLHDPSRAPVLVLGTLWPGHWDTLTTSDRHAGARELLGEHKIDVPDAFTPADLAALDAGEGADPRVAEAARRADDAQVTQYLAGAPVLMGRYSAARGATRALIHAAMDARRLGAGPQIPLDWLADAAPGYLTETEYRALDADWLNEALAYVTTRRNGIPGILTPVNTHRPPNQRTRRRPAASGAPAHLPAPGLQGPHYLLADYLDQHGRRHRTETIPPIAFWTAAAHHAHPTDMTELGDAAWARGLYLDATRLHRQATAHGVRHAAVILVSRLHDLHLTDHHAARWAVAHVASDDPAGVADLLEALWEAGADEQAAVLAERAAAHIPLDHRAAIVLLEVLWEGRADEQAATLIERAAAHAALDNPGTVADLLEVLREAGADEQAATLIERVAAHAALDNPGIVARLLEVLWEAGADGQAATLIERAAAHTTLDNPAAVARLLEELRKAGADEQISVLLARDPAAHAHLNNARGVILLLETLWEAGASEQVTTLAERVVTHTASLNNPDAVALLLTELREAGADEQIGVLMARNPAAHVTPDGFFSFAALLEELRKIGADKQATTLAERLPAAGHFDRFIALAGNREKFRFGREPDGSAAPSWTWNDTD
ncbi:hypothetical protein ACF1BN_22060 [Streptomyces sp. NPDC014861]|uniref:hypothetical protein n=1 Tax=Streptomyces sp. NPDC014861 TaxID=3364923 RepID=UPI0036FDD30D